MTPNGKFVLALRLAPRSPRAWRSLWGPTVVTTVTPLWRDHRGMIGAATTARQTLHVRRCLFGQDRNIPCEIRSSIKGARDKTQWQGCIAAKDCSARRIRCATAAARFHPLGLHPAAGANRPTVSATAHVETMTCLLTLLQIHGWRDGRALGRTNMTQAESG